MSIEDRKYTKITRDQILSDLQSILVSKVGSLADLGKSAYGEALLELFAAHADTDAAWIEAAFKDSFLETATSEEAIYVGARSLGYSVRRPTPAKAGFGIALKRTGIYATVKVNIPKGTQFTVAGKTLTAIDDTEFSYDRNDANFENGLMTTTSGRAVLAEGVIQTQQFFSDGTKNQEFIVAETGLSDWFGYGDPNYVEPDEMADRIGRFTVISSDASLIDNPQTVEGYEEKIYWKISRRGLTDPSIDASSINEIDDFVASSSTNLTVNYSTLITTTNDGRAKIEFGDGIISAIPYGVIDLKYFATNGEFGNATNVSGTEIAVQGSNILITQEDGSASDLTLSDLSIALTTDIRGGLNIEDIESIRKNAPKLYNSLDSLHNSNSYQIFLHKISDVKYANAFGEDVLNKIKPKGKFDIRYANIVRFTLLKDLYRKKDSNYFITDPSEYYVEGYKVNGLTYLWDYDYDSLPNKDDFARLNIKVTEIEEKITTDRIVFTSTDSTGASVTISTQDFMKDYIMPYDLSTPLVPESVFVAKLEPKDFIVTGSELDTIIDQLNRRGYLTMGNGQHSFVPPIVHELTMDINVVLFEGGTYTDIKTKIINTIYEYLKENTEFAKPIFRSKIESLVQKLTEVAGLNLYFKAKDNTFTGLDLNNLDWLGENTSQFINQSSLSLNGFDVTLEYDYTSSTGTETLNNSQTFTIGNQSSIQNKIKGYYNTNIAFKNSEGNIVPKTNLTEEDINKFTSYIWSIAMNEMYNSLFTIYLEYRADGRALEADKIFGVLESLRGWYFVNGELAFKDTDNITNMQESGSDNILAFYKIYTLEYIKMVRNILASVVANRLIDENGNVSVYSNQNEIVQFNIKPSNITITVGNV